MKMDRVYDRMKHPTQCDVGCLVYVVDVVRGVRVPAASGGSDHPCPSHHVRIPLESYMFMLNTIK